MGAQRAGILLILIALSGCARERTDLPATRPPSASERAAEARARIEDELRDLTERSGSGQERKGEVQSRVLETRTRIATLSAELQNVQAHAAAERGIYDSQLQKEVALRQQQLRELSDSIQLNDEHLQSRERELRFNLGPTGTSYEGDANLNSLRREIERLRARGIELRSAYASLADENRGAVERSAGIQRDFLREGQRRQSELAASVSEAQAELSRLERESSELDAAAKADEQRAGQLRGELAKLQSP